MIEKIRHRLVWGYTLVIVVIMIVTANIGVHALNHFIVNSYSQSLIPLLDMEAKEALSELQEWYNSERIPDIDGAKNMVVLEYLFDRDGKLVEGEGVSSVTGFLKREMPTWRYENRKAVNLEFVDASTGKKWSMLIMVDDIYDGDILLGKTLVGINVSPIESITHNYIAISSIIVVLTSIIAYFVGNYFAGKATKPIEVSMQAQQDFIANASHELRTPLSILLSSVDMIETESSKEIVKDMKDEILQMRELINSLLILTKPESEASKWFVNFNLAEVAKNTLFSMQLIADKKNINILSDIEESISFYGDPAKIRQLLVILLDNAIKYSPEGTSVIIKIKRKTNSIEIKIVDSGSGIAEKDLPHVFERFYRSDSARAKFEGFGLGLPMAKFITEIHNGTIKIDSSIDQGLTVLLTMSCND